MMMSKIAFHRKRPLLLLKVFSSELLFKSPSSASFSTNIVGQSPILVRDFIRSALYDPNHGYFSKRPGSVGLLERSIKFNNLQGRSAYLRHLNNLYKQNDIAWFTPVELFKPWYAHGIAEAILRTADLSVPLKIYEIGGGSGTCAKCIMDYMMLNAPAKVYNNMVYVSVEISSSLAKKQLETVGDVRSHLSRYRVECRDAADRSGWGDVDPQPCWVIMLEVLDNFPHDLIYSENQVSPWMEVWLQKRHDSECISELYKPLQDPLISRCIEIIDMDKNNTTLGSKAISATRSIWSKIFPQPRRVWLPTGCLQLLDVLHWALPKMSLIASDFSYLPDVKISGERAPLVSTKKDGSSADYSSYLDAKGDADIFFPTDFWLLERIDHHCSGWLNQQPEFKSSKQMKRRRTIILDTAAFMEEFGLPSKTRTKDGYNPLLDDFKNTKFYLSVPTHNKR
ncbi:protein arginine methyltransferase NDUFAF7 homolog, mitochondrial isoform X1 [Magnolia sinica]|uniref:protein arginine methyltransferase NDUFAF7 homolog, mitochondrial isoform X1 n=1 Tax=Magnolia sinica TaxID=86752 RepID=UPI002658EC7E|nr:protein arginine methyltransferase NDUFAF7 homolog, mitochondrial isoform X1 [Magnolia sinica]